MHSHDCGNEAMRDLLPLLAHDALEPGDAGALDAHLAACPACRDELALLRTAVAAISASAPRVSTAAILAGVQRRTRLKVERAAPARRRLADRWMPRRYAAAAASLILVASASLAVLARTYGTPADVTINGATASALDTASGVVLASAGLSVAGGLADLTDDDLAALLAELDRVEATVDAEPVSMRRALVDDQENF